MSEKGIVYHIDSFEKDGNDFRIMGWAFSNNGSVSVAPLGKYDYDMSPMTRLDVQAYFADKTDIAADCGFEMTIKNVGKKMPALVFSDGTEELVENWKARKCRGIIKKLDEKFTFVKKCIGFLPLKDLYKAWKEQGIKGIAAQVEKKPVTVDLYEQRYLNERLTEALLAKQRFERFDYMPLISILAPICDAPPDFLKSMTESVINQTYANWEFIVVSGSDNEKARQIVLQYAENDDRIKLKLSENGSDIVENANVALAAAKGEYISFLDCGDILTPDALYEVAAGINSDEQCTPDFIYSDEDKTDNAGKHFFAPHFKPDFSPHYLMSINYIGHLTVVANKLLTQVGRKLYKDYEGAQDYDLVLRCTEKARHILHIPKVLYHCRNSEVKTNADFAEKQRAHMAGKKALEARLTRTGMKGCVFDGIKDLTNGLYYVEYDLWEKPLVSIIIPNNNHCADLKKCLDSVWLKTTYPNYEIIVAENNSTDDDVFAYYDIIKEKHGVKIVTWDKPFNYAAINNKAAKESNGQYLVFLNNDIEIITPNWIERMVMFAQVKENGIVGAKLYYPDGSIQHGGVIIGIGGVAGHSHKAFSHDDCGYFCRLAAVQDLSAVTGAMMLIRRDVFEEMHGFDETYPIAFNDIDFCLRVREAGYYVIFNPNVEAYHYESKSRGVENTLDKKKRFQIEGDRFIKRWGYRRIDPYYNPNLTLDKEDFSLRY